MGITISHGSRIAADSEDFHVLDVAIDGNESVASVFGFDGDGRAIRTPSSATVRNRFV